ncbi:hypothetical protein LAM21_24275, partial [Mycobacterium tuberculosis]|nr:hypothetical protein [Mycobacterium tuberculosis]
QWQETEQALSSRSEVCSNAESDDLAYDSDAGHDEPTETKEKTESKEKLTAFIRSDVARLRQPEPPFWGRKVVEDFDLAEVFS